MEDEEYGCPQLLDLIPNEREIWKPRPAADHHGTGISTTIQEKQLELRLAPPGVVVEEEEPLNYSSSKSGAKRGFLATVLTSSSSSSTTPPPPHVVLEEELLQRRGAVVLGMELADKKPCCSPVPVPPAAAAHACAAVAHSSPQTRAVSTPVVGWPPVRSFRKSLASTSNKPSVESQKPGSEKATKPDNGGRGSLVKINMEGVPIGRKVDLKAYDGYDRLSLAVEELFRGLLEAQRDPKAVGGQKHTEKSQALRGLVDGTGEYTLVYEDDEGDKMLVDNVPWEMFVAEAKRLRVLKTSELALLHLGNKKRTATRC